MLSRCRQINCEVIAVRKVWRESLRNGGRGALSYLGRRLFALVALTFCVPAFPSQAADDVASLSTIIDQQVAAGWEKATIQPAEICADEEFLRRIYLDLTGRIPTREELEAFLTDNSATKRQRCIEQLLGSNEYVGHWANNLNALLQGPTAFPMSAAWGGYLRGSIASGKGWDQIARELILARPASEDAAGATEFLARRFSAAEPLDEVTRDVTRLFFGVDMQCARCHVHPEIAEWEPTSYWGMAAFFNRSYSLKIGERAQLGERARGEVSFTTADKKTLTAAPRFMTGGTPPPQPPPLVEDAAHLEQRKKAHPDAKDGNPLLDNPNEYHLAPGKNPLAAPLPLYSRRQLLVELAVNSSNPYFAPAIVNRVWAAMLGHGLVEPLDQMHSANPASHPALLSALAEDFGRHGYDFRRLLAAIAGSRAYQLASDRPGEPAESRPSAEQFAVANMKPLSQQQYATALLCAVGCFDAAGDRAKFDEQQAGRIVQYVKQLDWGSERFQPSLQVSLFLANNAEFDKLIAEGGLARRLSETPDDAAVAQTAFEAVLSRRPAPEEADQVTRFLAARNDRRFEACKQLVWSLVNSSEFRFNH